MTADDLVLREGHLHCLSVPSAPRATRNTDVGGDCLADGDCIDRWVRLGLRWLI